MRWSERRIAVRSTFEMTSALSLRATRALARRRSSCVSLGLMRLLAVFTFVLLPICAFAQENYGVVLNDVTDAKGNRLQFRTDTNTLARTSDWSPGTQDPPLTIPAVTRIAIEAGKRRLPKAD